MELVILVLQPGHGFCMLIQVCSSLVFLIIFGLCIFSLIFSFNILFATNQALVLLFFSILLYVELLHSILISLFIIK